MSLFRSSIRPPAILSDEAVERYLASVFAASKPDPLFRRRLRGQVLNQYVEARERHRTTSRSGRMGRLGRAVLYASFALGVSVTGGLAASQEALPGDLLYPLKLQVEELRLRVAPAHLRDDLAAYALTERVEELGRILQRGDAPAAAALTAAIEAQYAALVSGEHPGEAAIARHLVVLEQLVERLPDGARAAIEEVLERGDPAAGASGSQGQGHGANEDPGPGSRGNGQGGEQAAPPATGGPSNGSDGSQGNGNPDGNDGANGNGTSNGGEGSDTAPGEQGAAGESSGNGTNGSAGQPSPPAKPDPTPKATPGPRDPAQGPPSHAPGSS